MMGTEHKFLESRALRVVLDEFLESAKTVKDAREVLYGEAPSADPKAVRQAVNAIFIQIPVLRTAADTFEWMIEQIDEEPEEQRLQRRSR